ncbi:hypothetical protein RIVM261_074160 [Rivularia sp. IAM M-261]|nr:hypothetical protein RIVM261_074160 [Rivularia sp. IAM M-261]
MSQPDLTDLELCRQLISEILDFSLANRNELLAQKKINNDEFIEIRKQIEEPLRKIRKDITLKLFDVVSKKFGTFESQITSVTANLNTVIDDLEGFNTSIKFLSKVVDFFGGILTAASQGLAGVPKILDGLNKIME